MTVTPPEALPVLIPITWPEIIRTPDRQLRRLISNRYRQALHTRDHTCTLVDSVLSHAEQTAWVRDVARRHQVDAMLDAEVSRLEAAAQAGYEAMALDYTARIRAGERTHREPLLTLVHDTGAAA